MARLFSNLLLKNIANFRTAQSPRVVSGPFCNYGMRYSTTVSNHPDSHEDNLQPNDKDDSFDGTWKDYLDMDVKENPIMIYMNGTPRYRTCRFGVTAKIVLDHYKVTVGYRNVLDDPELKEAVREYSGYLTFPQIFIKGEFIGGADTFLEMHENGELKQKIQDLEESDLEESD